MKCKLVFVGIALLSVSSSWAATDPYYSIEEISVDAGDNATYGPYPSAMSDDGTLIGTYSMRSLLSRDIDIGLPFTFNRGCQYDTIFCEVEFYGSESTSDDNYENGYQAWRNAQADADTDVYSSYMMANVYDTKDTEITTDDTDTSILPFDESSSSTDVKVTDVMGDSDEDQFVVGYSSGAYSSYARDFVRRAFIKNQDTSVITSLLPDFDDDGGFSSAYKIKKVTYADDSVKTLVIGSSSISRPEDDDDYFDNCYFSDTTDEISTLNELVYCPGFDTQAWAWDVSDVTSINSFELASEWLDDNEENNSSYLTYSASALDINASGIAVGVSTFESSDTATGGRQRAIIMYPDDNDTDEDLDYTEYFEPTELTKAVDDVGDDDGDIIYNTWAIAITDGDDSGDGVVVLGNREYSVSTNVNMPTQFFIYDIDENDISFPLKDEMVLTTEQQKNGESSASTGANSRAYDINEDGFVVGKSDDYDQTHPVYGGMPRTQSAFLYDSNKDSDDYDESWYINDLICTEEADGSITSPRYKIRSARVISDTTNGIHYVLAEGWKYSTDDGYQNETGATEVMLKLTHNSDSSINASSPGLSPNCWNSDLLSSDDSYDRSGAAGFWLWIFALPLLLVRRFFK